MKKITLFGVVVTMAMMMASCDDLNLNNLFSDDDVLGDIIGNATVVISRNGAEGPQTDSIRFISSITDVFDVTVGDMKSEQGASTIDISANVELNDANVELEFPFMYFRLGDTVSGVYPMDTIVTLDLLQGLNFERLVDVLADPAGGNMVLIAENDSCWYITYSGNLTVAQYPTVGKLVEGTFNGIGAWYITQSKVNELNDDINNYNLAHIDDLEYYFPRVTLTGNFSSRRWALIHSIFDAAFTNGGIVAK
jgi:hypothetical protein